MFSYFLTDDNIFCEQCVLHIDIEDSNIDTCYFLLFS